MRDGIQNPAGTGAGRVRTREAFTASGIPVEEISLELQPVLRTLLGVELGRKNIIACQGGGKALAVVGLPYAVGDIGGPGVEAVDEIEVALVGHPGPDRVWPRLQHLVPAHLR